MDISLIPMGNGKYRIDPESLETSNQITSPTIPMEKTKMSKFKKIGIFIAALFILRSVFGIASAFNYQSPEELRQAAIEAKMAAMAQDCKTIAERYTACVSADWENKSAPCTKMQESYAWFYDTYGASPDYKCTVEPDPLTLGAELE